MTSLESEELRQLWAQRVDAFFASGLSGAQWCAQEHLPPKQLSYWKRKLANADATASAPSWFAVPMAPESQVPNIVVRVGDVAIEVQSGFNPDLLRAVVRTFA